jgi:transcriptional regulator with XRE-family HTH domain
MNHDVTREEFDSVLDRLQDLEDAEFMRAVEADPLARDYLPLALMKRLLAGGHPVTIWREQRGLSVTGLAEKAGVTRSYLSEIEAGKKPGSVAAYRQLAEALGVSIDDVVPDNEPSSSQKNVLRFELHQRYIGKNSGDKIAEVIQIDDEGRKACVQVRNLDDELLVDGDWVFHLQFLNAWKLL